MHKVFLLLQFLQVLPLVFGGPLYARNSEDVVPANINTNDGAVLRSKRQSGTRNWTVSAFSQCSATCGGGLRTRSVRCLDEDGVISSDCSPNRPASFEFCNQIDCVTNNPDSSLLPATDSYDFNNPDGSRSIVQFENQGSGVYRIQQNTTESDGVLTSVDRDSMSSQTRIRTSGVTSSTSIQRIGDDDFALLVDGNSILNSNINRLVESNVGNGQTVTYRNSTLTILNGDTVNNISMFTYYDGFRFYRFNETKINPLSGNGRLFYSPDTGMAIYSIDPQFTSFLSTMISLLRNGSSTATSPSVPAATTGSVFPTSSTGPQQPVTTGPQQPATTGPQQPATTGPQQPATTGSQQPATTGPQQPATTGPQQPATTGPQQPATTGSQQPATTGPQQPATNPPSIPSTTDEPDVCETRSKSSDRSKTSKTRRRSKSKHRSRSKSKHRSRSHKDVSNECNEETGTDSEVDTPNEGSKSHSPRSRGRKSRGRKSRGSKHPSSSRTSKKTKKSRKPKRKG